MRYNNRCDVVAHYKAKGYLGYEDKKTILKNIPCSVSSFGLKEQSVVFGSFNKKAFKVHIQGFYKVDHLTINGIEYQPITQSFHHNSTVLVVSV